MAGTVTVTEQVYGSVKRVKFAWESDASGDADQATTHYYDGKVLGLTTVPDATDAPTADYDITVTNEDGVDVLMGAGADRATAATEHVAEGSLGATQKSKLTLNVSNAGNAKKGTVYFWVR